MAILFGQALLDYSGGITVDDVNRLLKAAGYGPLRAGRIRILP